MFGEIAPRLRALVVNAAYRILGGGPNQVLYQDANQVLGSSANLTFIPALGTLTSGQPAGHRIQIDARIGDHPRINFIRADGTGLLIFDWYFDGGTSPAWRWYADKPANLLTFQASGTSYRFDPQVGFSTDPLDTARLSIGTAAGDRVGLLIKASSGQTAPLVVCQGLSSTSTRRDLGYLDMAFVVSTDASHTGRVTLSAADYSSSHTGRREGFRVESDGTQVLTSVNGVAAVARAAAIATPTDLATCITAVTAIRDAIKNFGITS